MLYGLDLFSGIGGIGIALKPWVRTVTYCEQDRYAQGVLLSRMQSGEIDSSPIWDDVRSLTKDLLPPIDIIFGGFPCQDISLAGNGKGLGGERSGLFYEIIRLTKEVRPAFIFLENVPAIRTRGLEQVIKNFTEIGYDCRWTCLSAASVGAPHKRERWFLLAHSNSSELRKQSRRLSGQDREETTELRFNGSKQFISNADSNGSTANLSLQTRNKRKGILAGGNGKIQSLANTNSRRCESGNKKIRRISVSNKTSYQFWSDQWKIEPDVGRVVDGLQDRAHRIKCLGNSVVPLQVQTAFKILMGIS